jgi:hypothetical protein
VDTGLGGLVFDQFDATHHALAAHIANMRMTVEFGVQPVKQEGTPDCGLLSQFLFLDEIEGGEADRSVRRVTAVNAGMHPRLVAVANGGRKSAGTHTFTI